MAKWPRSLPSINHPCFSKQSHHLIQVSTMSGNFFFHVSQLLEFINYNELLRTMPVGQIGRQPSPLGYDLVACTWNDQALSMSHCHFAVVNRFANQNQLLEILAVGQPMKMGEFLIITDDCNMTSNHAPIDSDDEVCLIISKNM